MNSANSSPGNAHVATDRGTIPQSVGLNALHTSTGNLQAILGADLGFIKPP